MWIRKGDRAPARVCVGVPLLRIGKVEYRVDGGESAGGGVVFAGAQMGESGGGVVGAVDVALGAGPAGGLGGAGFAEGQVAAGGADGVGYRVDLVGVAVLVGVDGPFES